MISASTGGGATFWLECRWFEGGGLKIDLRLVGRIQNEWSTVEDEDGPPPRDIEITSASDGSACADVFVETLEDPVMVLDISEDNR